MQYFHFDPYRRFYTVLVVPTFYKENSGLVEKENANMAEKNRNFKDQKV
ncbi:hypothetical protein LEP1GSC008_3873 [Leptospira kirschneri serovar Bulgarica str. Nikolaevo]|uniref:Uncharacterized protein n=1 Tax=Leptospira kirschneri serovar Bulgarica str. Nikolaevo TaxID=1240687 RepID=M6EXK2_9LEPT|nr:hypothetical protein LEP1GSC008_3873 [Leptospira kirschneri serovar Bulgarica str. Nikolaevo]